MSADKPNHETRVYRRIFRGIHLVVAVVFASMLALGIWNGVADVRPARALAPAPVEVCVEQAATLREELLARLGSFPHAASAAEEGAAFEQWSVAYRARLLDARAHCKPPANADAEQIAAVKAAYAAVVRTLDLSAIAATHWARHLGPALDESAEAIEAARATR